MRRLIAVLAVSASMLSVFASTSANAADGFAFTATASLPTFPCTGSCTGTLTGLTIVGTIMDSITDDVTFTYSEPNCEFGSASATWETDAGETLVFEYDRIGVAATISGSYAGAAFTAVGVFVPEADIADRCNPVTPVAGGLDVTVVGAGANTDV